MTEITNLPGLLIPGTKDKLLSDLLYKKTEMLYCMMLTTKLLGLPILTKLDFDF